MTSRTDNTTGATFLSFPGRAGGPASTATSRREIERAVARGRTLQGEALRGGFRHLFRFLVDGCSLRKLRIPGHLPGHRHSCC
jgi:hypothetical protein